MFSIKLEYPHPVRSKALLKLCFHTIVVLFPSFLYIIIMILVWCILINETYGNNENIREYYTIWPNIITIYVNCDARWDIAESEIIELYPVFWLSVKRKVVWILFLRGALFYEMEFHLLLMFKYPCFFWENLRFYLYYYAFGMNSEWSLVE